MKRQEILQPNTLEQQGVPRNPALVKPDLPKTVLDLSNEDSIEKLVDVMLSSVFENLGEQEKVVSWARDSHGKYSGLPERTVGQKIIVKEFVRNTAIKLLENVQHINIVNETWVRTEAQRADTGESREPFSQRVKKDSLILIKEKWRDVTSEQLAQLVRIYADNNNPHQDFAKAMLTNYFKGPPNRCRPRVAAYYNFVSGVLELAGEDDAFREGMKVVLYATDILPKDPGLMEQVNILSLPSDEEEKGGVFQKLLTIESVTKQAIFMSSQDFSEYFRSNENFARTDAKIIKEWKERKVRVTREMGSSAAASAKNNAVRAAMSVFLNSLREPLTEEKKQELMGIWPFDEAFKEDDPLNQKLERVKLQLASAIQTH